MCLHRRCFIQLLLLDGGRILPVSAGLNSRIEHYPRLFVDCYMMDRWDKHGRGEGREVGGGGGVIHGLETDWDHLEAFDSEVYWLVAVRMPEVLDPQR